MKKGIFMAAFLIGGIGLVAAQETQPRQAEVLNSQKLHQAKEAEIAVEPVKTDEVKALEAEAKAAKEKLKTAEKAESAIAEERKVKKEEKKEK